MTLMLTFDVLGPSHPERFFPAVSKFINNFSLR